MKTKKHATIYTDRLCLRPFMETDTEDMLAILTNKEIAKTYMLPDFASYEDAKNLFERLKSLSHSHERFVYGIDLDGRIIGYIHDVQVEQDEVEVGYVIYPDHKGQGFATESLKGIIGEFFHAGFQSVTAGAFEGNIASMRVMEKSGMTLIEKTEQIPYRDQILHCIFYKIDATP